jgi:hypothetical protein
MESGSLKMTLQEEARAALSAKGHAEQDLARVAVCPPWRHALFGLVMGGLVVTPALPLTLRFVAMALILVSIGLIVRSDRRRMGMFINGYRRGKTLAVSLPLLAAVLALYWLSARAGLAGDHVTPLLLGVAAFVVSVLGSVIWQRVFVSELSA